MDDPKGQSLPPYNRHNPRLAMLLSVVPGLGQVYNRRYMKGILLFVIMASFLLVFGNFLNIGYWGIVTLGTLQGVDDSRVLLIQGIVSIILTVFGLGVYVFNLRDAKKEAERIRRGWRRSTLREGFKQSWDKGFPYLLVAPGFLMVVFVLMLPLFFMIALAFTNYNIYNAPPRFLLSWVGIKNFISIFSVPIWRKTFFSVLSWTVVWTIVATTLQIGTALFLAIIVNDKRIRFKKLIRTVLILPWAVPGFVSILTFAAMFNDQFGAINNQILSVFGLSIPWMSDPFWTKVAIIFIEVWLGTAFVFALFTGVLQSVSGDWYEAAEVDGASKWQKFRNITLPHVLFATAPLLIMQYTGNFNNFNLIYLFNQGGPPVRGQTAGSSDIVISWVYKLTFDTLNYNMAAVISIMLGIIVATVAFFQFRRTRSFKEGGKL
ncbi:ABC transporter permease subunit [Gorillibacterium sp. sgz500922]|uniref:carbohydrate ABC transporter permease n=1 Tax=Gorillibacterium sp. sgz500922 TaxID=3446694 RepID=UPI003F67FEFA